MASSIRTQILDDIATALESVTETNGYNRTFRTISRKQLFPTEPLYDLAYVSGFGETKVDSPLGYTTCELSVMVVYWVEDAQDLDTAIDDAAADITKALYADPERSALAIETHIVNFSEAFELDQQTAGGAVAEVVVTYRHTYGNPYTQTPHVQ